MTEKLVRVHSAVRHGGYAYYRASLFVVKDLRYVNSGISTDAVTTLKKAERLGRELAQTHDAKFVEGFGSLHNRTIDDVPTETERN